MPETYLSGGDTLASVDHPNREGQTFVLREDFVLDFIDLQMKGAMRLNTPNIQVFNAEITGEPWGPCLSRDRHIVEQKSGLFTTGRVRFSMQPTLLARPERFVLIVSNYPGLLGNPASWQYDKDDATYPRGIRISSNDGGDTWTPHYDDDFMFAMWGNPPLIKPYPPPPIDNTAILGITYIHDPDALFINLSTCDPCHLWAYISETPPRKYMTSRTTRGLAVPWHVYYSFVEWAKVEQTELGDTLYHTFELPSWSECQTKWLTFRGEIDNVQSPSVGPIFTHHHTGLGPSLIEEQTEHDVKQSVGWASCNGWGQKLNVSNRIISKLGFWLSEKGLGGFGTVSFRIYRNSDKALLASKDWGPASHLPALPEYLEVELDDPIFINDEVVIIVWVPGNDHDNCAYVWYKHSDVKPNEYLSVYVAGWAEYPAEDAAYKYTYHQ